MLTKARLITRRKLCPSCGSRTDRVRTPMSLRWLKPILGPRMSVRRCYACRGWKGLTFDGRAVRQAGDAHANASSLADAPPAGPVLILSNEPAEAAVMASALVLAGNEAVVLAKHGINPARVARFSPRIVLVHAPSAAGECHVLGLLGRALRPVPVVGVDGVAGLSATLEPA